jgi:outer membrane lipoprotein-sorting protein
MHTVAIRLHAADFFEKMRAMRIWLDERRFEPSTFEYKDAGNFLIVKVSFKDRGEAMVFEQEFRIGGLMV